MTRRAPPQSAPKSVKKGAPSIRSARKAEQEAARLRRQRNQLIGVLGVVIGVLVIGGLALVISRSAGTGSTAGSNGKPRYFPGSAAYCITAQPPFVQKFGFSSRAALDTRSQDVRGIILYDLDQNGKPTRSYQDPSWVTAGYLGPPAIDKAGNIYVIPIPAVNVLYNPPDKANILYKIDGQTGKMAPLIDLPPGVPVSPDSTYGLLGVTYDCDTNSLYASSVLGSSRFTQAGRIVRIDLATGQVASQIANIDAFGLAVFNTAQGKRLYFGLARSPQVMSIALDDKGNFTGDARTDITLANLGFHGDERARLISFSGTDTMQVQTIQFDFNLVAPTEARQTSFNYTYDSTHDTWQLISSTPTNVG